MASVPPSLSQGAEVVGIHQLVVGRSAPAPVPRSNSTKNIDGVEGNLVPPKNSVGSGGDGVRMAAPLTVVNSHNGSVERRSQQSIAGSPPPLFSAPPPTVAGAAIASPVASKASVAATSPAPGRVRISPDFPSSASPSSGDDDDYRGEEKKEEPEEEPSCAVAPVAADVPAPATKVPAAAAAATPPGGASLSPDFASIASRSSGNDDYRGEEKKEEPEEERVEEPSGAVAPVAAAGTASARGQRKRKPAPAATSTRRSGRKRTSTTMIIDGHAVKRCNNYVIDDGAGYSMGAFEADAPKPPKKPKLASSGAKRVWRRPAYLEERRAHNEAIKKRMAGEDNTNRMHFMTNHREALAPFVDRKVASHLHANGKHAEPEPDNSSVLGSQPDSIITTLRDYQMLGLDWMVKMHSRGMPFILGDEMGLGKTLQTIALICHLKETDPTFSGPSLVICPLSVLYSWCNEVVKHAPSLKYFRFHASEPKEREAQKATMLQDILNYDIVITTYDMAKTPAVLSLVRTTYFNLCVLDEGHVIKSLTSQIGDAVRKIHSRGRVILTGTPMQNNLVELYAILNYLYPQYFTTPDKFASSFNITLNKIDPGMLLKANKLLKLFMIRRLKDEVEKLMPKKIETKILCPLSSSQIFWYKGFLMNEIESLVKMMEDGSDNNGKHNMLRNLIIQLRKVCLHPYLFDFAEGAVKEDTGVEELVATSGKLAVLDKLLISLFKNGHRTCIFSQFTSMLNILEDYCNLRGWNYCRFDGSTPRAQRNHIINRFNAPGSDVFIFLMSTRSGGLGINLQTADTCILYDSDWNPQPDLQAMARVHRIGQKKTVHVYRLLSAGTIEERVVERAEKKLYLDQMVNRGTSNQEMDAEGTSLSTAELLSSLKFGSNAVFSSSNDLPTESDIDKVTDRARTEECSDGLLKGGAAKTASDYDKDKVLTDTRNFCGVDFRKLREEKEAKMKGNGPKSMFLSKLKQDWKEVQTDEVKVEMGKGKRTKKSRLLQVESKGSGWGSSLVPVLAMNDYDLLSGEPSAWGRETKKVASVPKKEKKVNDFINQDFCQFCGDGGTLIECPRCPVSVHSRCCGLKVNNFQCCTHHNCVLCHKNAAGAGGLIYRCQSCPNAYCPDCLPNEPYRYLGTNVPRFEKLGFTENPLYFYIHCSKQCEEVAKLDFGFKLEESKLKCPPNINVTFAFGKDALDVKDMAKMFNEKADDDGRGNEEKSPARPSAEGPTGSRVSSRKRSLTPKASAAAGMPGIPAHSGTVVDLSGSTSPATSDSDD